MKAVHLGRRAALAAGLLLAAMLRPLAAPGAPAGDRPDAGSAGPTPGAIQALIDTGRYDEALATARERLAAVESAAGPDAPEVARAIDLVLKAGYWSSRPKDPELLALAKRAVAIDEKTAGPDDPRAAESLLGEAFILIARGESDAAQALCGRALAIQERSNGPESLAAAQAHRCLGLVSEDRDDLHGAVAEAERALAVQEKILGPEHPDVAGTLNDLASVQRQLGDYPHAIESRKRCLAIREKAFGPDHPQVAWALHNLANLHADLGEFSQARDLYLRALAIRERIEPPDHPDLGYSHNSLGVVAAAVGDYPAARVEYEKALAIREKALGPDHALVAATLNNLGDLLDRMGELEEARDDLRRALEIKSRRLGAGHSSTMLTAVNLANVLAETGDYAGAEELSRRALAADEKDLGPDHAEVGRVLDDLGWLRHLRGDSTAAAPLLERALAIRAKALGEAHPEVADTLIRLAIARLESGGAAAALPAAERALEIRTSVLGPDHADVAATLALLASIRLRLGDVAGALDAALRSEPIGREQFRLTARHLSQREALRYEQVRPSGVDVALQALDASIADPAVAARAGEVLDLVVRSRALVLDAIASRRRQAAEARTEDAARRVAAMNDAASALARLVRRDPDPDHPERFAAQVREARAAEERAERDLVSVSPTERERIQSDAIGLAEVRRALPEGAALLSYVRFTPPAHSGSSASRAAATAGAGYLAFVTTAGDAGATRAVRLGSAARIDGLVRRWREEAARGARGPGAALRGLEASYRAAALALRQAIWDPVSSVLAGPALVFVVPDGALDVVNLAALPEGKDRYLIESGPILHGLSAERDLITAARPRAPGGGLLVVGGADYGPAPPPGPHPAPARGSEARPCSPFQALRFAPLPGAGEEADIVTRLFAGRDGAAGDERITRLSGSDARAGAFLSAAVGKRVLHVATHGFFLEDPCPAGTAAPPTDPMLLSGLAFAGANRRAGAAPRLDDGLLTAEEIAACDLSSVEWAVLSACDTGLGEIRGGEGVLGLRRAFEIAGAGTLIMSLWTVRDEDAKEWARALYEARFASLDTPHAMARAGARLVEKRRREGRSTHPAGWGAFVACGAWR